MAYQYQTIYGVEPYAANGVPASADFGGGAKVTNNNLLITLWDLPGFSPGADPPVTGTLVKPFVNTATGQAVIAGAASGGIGLEEGFSTFFDSRYSARILLSSQVSESNEPPILSEYLMAVLQPPQDLKNYVLWLVNNLDTSAFTLDFTGSFFQTACWDFKATDTFYLAYQESALFGGADFGSGLKLLLTNGANGVFPVFENIVDTATAFAALRALVRGGTFYVPVIFSRSQTLEDDNGQEVFTFSWPGSNARR
jgi:hypothetical protein